MSEPVEEAPVEKPVRKPREPKGPVPAIETLASAHERIARLKKEAAK